MPGVERLRWGPAAARRVPAGPAAGFLSEQHLQDLGGSSVDSSRWRSPPVRAVGCGAAAGGAATRRARPATAAPGNPNNWWSAGHWWTSLRRSVPSRWCPVSGSGLRRGVHRRGRVGGGGGPGSRRVGRRGPRHAQCPVDLGSGDSRRAGPRAILTRILVVPAAAASTSHSRAPSPARGTRPRRWSGPRGPFQGACRGGREVVVVEFRGARRGPVVAGHLRGPVRADVGDHHLLIGAVPWTRTTPWRP